MACLVICRGKNVRGFFFPDRTTQFINTLVMDVIRYKIMIVGTILDHAKVITVPYMCAPALSLSNS